MTMKILRTTCTNGELGMIELQGKLQFDEANGGDRARVGTFKSDVVGEGKSTIQTGRYLLHGDRKKLSKPLAVLQKSARRDRQLVFKLIGAVKEKLVYTSRPEPIIG